MRYPTGSSEPAKPPQPAREFRNIDGHDNNREHPEWGRAGERLLRFCAPAAYADGRGALARRGSRNPNPRVISSIVCREATPADNKSARGLSDFMWAWGQFLDHEIDLTPEETTRANIHVSAQDEELRDMFGEPFAGGTIDFVRSIFDPSTGHDASQPREQINVLSAFVDASNVYGADATRAAALRRFDGSGKLETRDDAGELLPFNLAGLENAFPGEREAKDFYLAGDVRANEHVVLSSLHTLFAREHNAECQTLMNQNPSLAGDDEAIYQRARQIVIGKMQAITYNEFLPALLGDGAIDRQGGYDSHVNPGIDNLFSTAAYRLGHSMLSNVMHLASPDGTTETLDFRDAFFIPERIEEKGIDSFLGGLWGHKMQEIDARAIGDIRNFLFMPPTASPTGSGGVTVKLGDLAARNIQRGRDHGLPDYNTCRECYGLGRVSGFAEISEDTEIQNRLEQAYGDVDSIDPWVGGLAETHAYGSVGPLFHSVLVDQFDRIRRGDRFFYEWDCNITQQERERIHTVRLSEIIRHHTGFSSDQVPDNVFRAPD